MDMKAITGIITAAIAAIGTITVAVINKSGEDPSKVKVVEPPTTLRSPASKKHSGKSDIFQEHVQEPDIGVQEPDVGQYPPPPF